MKWKPQHSPAPWKDENSGRIGFGCIIAADGSQVAVAYGKVTNPRAAENARLIEQAPEMFRLLAAIVEDFHQHHDLAVEAHISAASDLLRSLVHPRKETAS